VAWVPTSGRRLTIETVEPRSSRTRRCREPIEPAPTTVDRWPSSGDPVTGLLVADCLGW